MRASEKYISALVMHSKGREQGAGFSAQGTTKRLLTTLFLTLLILSSVINHSYAELVDRVVAVINRDIILYSELQDAAVKAKSGGEAKSEIEILEELVDRVLLLEQAMKFRVGIETYDKDSGEAREMIDDYINRRIKAFIHVPFEEIDRHYMSHKDDFGGRDVYQAWDEIENRLKVERLKIKLDEHISLLRKKAYIRIQLDDVY